MAEEQTPRISDAEWLVMDVIWENKRVTSGEIIKQLEGKSNWKEKTVKTLIRRLVDKGVAGYEADPNDRRVYYYYPKVDRDKCVLKETSMFLEKFYNGAVSSLVSKIVEKNEISEEEADELIRILHKKRK
jgi:BlaI family penicillinase repressor